MKTTSAIALVLCAGALAAATAFAQDYPNRPIKMIVPYGTAGVTDITARTIAPAIGGDLGQPVVVENHPGAATMLGTEMVAKARPDGYTLLLASGSALSVNPILFKKMSYDATKDLAPLSLVSTVPYVLVVHPSVVAKTVAEFVALAKAKPKTLNYSSSGNGSGNHITAEYFMNVAGIEATHVPYKSGGAMVSDLIGGHVAFAFAALPTAYPHVKAGTLRALGVSSRARNSSLPDVPTIAETVPGFVVIEWIGIFAPAGTPPAILERVSTAIAKSVQNPSMVEKLKTLGADAVGGTPAQLEAIFASDIARWAKLSQAVKLAVD